MSRLFSGSPHGDTSLDMAEIDGAVVTRPTSTSETIAAANVANAKIAKQLEDDVRVPPEELHKPFI